MGRCTPHAGVVLQAVLLLIAAFLSAAPVGIHALSISRQARRIQLPQLQHHPPQAARLATPPDSEASLQLAARQRLFDFAVATGLDLLDEAATRIVLPEYHTTLEVPVLGGLDVGVSCINVTHLDVPRSLARVAIESGYYHLRAANVTAQVSFNWTWSKGPLSGSGYGELALAGGSLDEIFLVRNQQAGVPQLVVVSSAVGFDSLELSIHSYSADWLYQALLFVFSGPVQRQVEDAIDGALHTDVPAAINGLLDSLPARVSVSGLPFEVVFTYAVYTLNYVLVKGYGEMAVDGSAAGPGSCPIPAGPLPLSPAQIGSEAGMFSGYVHASIPDCILWGLHNAGALKTIVQDGAIPGLRLITDLFGGLIPELPKVYPKRSVMLDVVLTAPPSVTLRGPAAAAAAGGGGLLLTSVYETNVSVVGAAPDGGNVLVARLTANVSIAADLGWETSSISSVNVSYAALWQALPVSLTGWNQAIEWVVRQAGPRQSLSALWDTYVTPAVPSFIGLAAVTTSTLDDWFVLSGDVVVRTIPSSQATLRVPQPA